MICGRIQKDTIAQTRGGILYGGMDTGGGFFLRERCPREAVLLQFVGEQLQNLMEQRPQIGGIELIKPPFLRLQTIFCEEGEGAACESFQTGNARKNIFAVKRLCRFRGESLGLCRFADALLQKGKVLLPLAVFVKKAIDILPEGRKRRFCRCLPHFAAKQMENGGRGGFF